MSLYEDIKNYVPINQQEEQDKAQMLQFMEHNADYLERSNLLGHFTASMWTVNKERTKLLMSHGWWKWCIRSCWRNVKNINCFDKGRK